jgi:hypothetical protein
MIGFEIKGLDEIKQKLEQLRRNAEKLSGEHTIPFSDLFTSDFMDNYTEFESIDEMIKSSGFPIESSEDIKELPGNEWNEFIQKHTCFPNWDEMVQTAAKEYFAKKLGLH